MKVYVVHRKVRPARIISVHEDDDAAEDEAAKYNYVRVTPMELQA